MSPQYNLLSCFHCDPSTEIGASMGREWWGRETLGVHDPLLGADSVNNGLKAGFE